MGTVTNNNPLQKSQKTMDLVQAVAKRVEIEQVQLLEASIKRGVLRDKPPGNVNIAFGASAELDHVRERILVPVRLTLTARYDDATPEEPDSLRIDVVFVVGYRVSPGPTLTKVQLREFGQLNGVFNVWPYWREFVHSTTSRMGLPALIMPSFKVGTPPTSLHDSTLRKAKKDKGKLPARR